MRIVMFVVCLWLATSPLYGKIVFYSNRDGNTEIYTMDSDGNNQTRLTFNEVSDSSPVWSPNGRQIAFHSKRDGNWEVYVMEADGSNPRNLTRHPANDNFPDWSPDGSQIAFRSTRRDDVINLYMMDADGSNVKQLTYLRFPRRQVATRPKWSPDGKWILFQGIIDEGSHVYAIRPDGTRRWRVSEPIPGSRIALGDWFPNGKQIVYYARFGVTIYDEVMIIIATLAPIGRSKVKKWEAVRLPKMLFQILSVGADGKSIFFSGRTDNRVDRWELYRFRLDTHELIQLTDNLWADKRAHEWDPRLPVEPQKPTPTRWGEIKVTK